MIGPVGSAAGACAAEQVALMLRGNTITQLIATAVRLRVLDHLGDDVVSEISLAELTGLEAEMLRRFMRALTGIGLVETVGEGKYRATALAAPLRRETGSLHGYALMAGVPYYQAWAELDHALRTGESAFEHRHGRDLWTLLDDDSESARSFARGMRWYSEHFQRDIFALYEFPRTGVVADLGAGDGTLISAVLSSSPALRGVAFEQQAMIDHARATVEAHGVAGRCEFVAGDFLREIPPGADLYLLKAVLHNWEDVSALRILRNCGAAMGERGRLLVIENPPPAEYEAAAAIHDMTMLVLFGGRLRTLEELRSLLERANFVVDRVICADSGTCLLEAGPIIR